MTMPVIKDKKVNRTNVETLPKFEYGVIWQDPISGHRVGCLDASKKEDVKKLMQEKKQFLQFKILHIMLI